MLEFEWDPDKAESNLRKHGGSFHEAATAFGDPLSITFYDPVISARKASRRERKIYEDG